ncbi:MAG: hypothetical protein A2168_09145 [Planctomycetes bacterium RBG_13_50_24]|nr:MAG: hypothetical protein A2168_09145 [Planctomycetes bacterium RBG_13_50_24]
MFNLKSLRNVITVAIVAILAAGGVWAAESAERQTAGMIGAIPAESLFCVHINNFDGTLDDANEFLKGVAPESLDAKAALLSKLGSLLGDNELKGVDKKGNIAIFGLNVPGESAAAGPMGNMFIGALLPVTEYEDFISGNPNCGKSDEQGISMVTVNGQPRGLATNFGRFALLCPPNARENLIKVRNLLAQGNQSLGSSLDADELKQAGSSPVWIYLNVKQGSKMIGPMLFGQLEVMKGQLQKMKESGESPMPIDPAGIINFYGGIFKMLLGGTDYVMLGLAPASDSCSLTIGVKAVPETEMAAIIGSPVEGDFGNILGYLDDGAMLNIGTKVDRPSLKAGYMKLFELLGQMIPDGIPEADLEEMKTLMTEGINALGDSIAVSVGVNGKGSSPFWGKYVIEVKDEKAFKEVLEKELRMMQDGAFGKLYKGFGMEMDVEINRGAGNYKGITIDAAKVNFKMSEKSMQSQMIEKMFGDGLDYCWAFVNNNCVYTIGGDADKIIRELIDQVKAGGPKKIGVDMKAAMDAIEGSRQADAVGTFNYVRTLNMATSFMIEGADSPDQVPTQSGIAFAARAAKDGKMKLQMVLPKKHLQEIQSAFKKLIPIMEKQQKEQREKQRSEQT